ncbi:hypothetical protein Vafri_3554 [Volvox africanus]|uniref:RRM domain-containing protein n=1 Tax=Volvox africanus TaxID=51714 RepID=A0A8J4AVN0_9CHLO|nr:hypothetical protein Vafri_3554 [Volvox africanus]
MSDRDRDVSRRDRDREDARTARSLSPKRSPARSPRRSPRRGPSRSPVRRDVRSRSRSPYRSPSRSRSPPKRARSQERDVRRRSPSRSRSRDRDFRRRSRSRSRDRRRSRSRSRDRRGRSRSPGVRYGMPPPGRTPPRVGTQLFVAGINFICNEQDLERKFSRYGRVKEARVVRNPITGESRGFAFVAMSSETEAADAIRDMNDREWNGRRLLVQIARNPR